MSDFIIVADSNADFASQYAEKNGIVEPQLTYLLDGKTYECNDPSFSRHEFYEKMRKGSMPKTAAVNMEQALQAMRPILEQGHDILSIAFSSGLSATYNSLQMAATELAPQFPERKIIVLDTLCASAGQALLVDRAVKYKNAGLSLEDTAQKIRMDMPCIATLVAIDDLRPLLRGGRISKAAAVMGSMLSIKPLIHVDNDGCLAPIAKVRGRKQSLITLVDYMEKQIDREKCDCFYISHGDALEDAQFVAAEITKRFGITEHTISYIGPTVGAHSGPGTIALFFYATYR